MDERVRVKVMRDQHVAIALYVLCSLSLGFGALMLDTSSAHAQEISASSRSAGMGEALTAGGSGTAALWHNPAAITSAIMYSAEAGYAYDAPTAASGMTASLLDTKSNPSLGLGLSFTYETTTSDRVAQHEGFHFRGGLGVPIITDFLMIGTTLRYSNVNNENRDDLEALLLDVGLLVKLTDMISLGVTGLNLVNGGYNEEMPTSIATGLAFGHFDYGINLNADVVFNISSSETQTRLWRVGGEYLVMQQIPIRVGFQHNEAPGTSHLTFGAGFRDRDRAVGLDAAFQQNLNQDRDRAFIASLSLFL